MPESEVPTRAEDDAPGRLKEDPLDEDEDELSEGLGGKALFVCMAATARARQFGHIPKMSNVSVMFLAVLPSNIRGLFLPADRAAVSASLPFSNGLSLRSKWVRRETRSDWRESGAPRA